MSATTINGIVALLLWTLAISRVGLLTRPGAPRALGLTLLTIAMAQSVRMPAVYGLAEDAVHSLIGYSGGSMLLKHTLAILAAANMLTLVQGPRSRPLRRQIATGGLLLFSVLVYVLDPEQASPALAAYDELYGTSLGLRLHWFSYLGYITWYLISMIHVCTRYRRQATSPDLRFGMSLVAVGSAVGLVHVPGKVAMLTAWSSGQAEQWLPVDAAGQAMIVGVCLLLTALGSSWQTLRSRGRQMADIRRAWRSTSALTPLWLALTTAVPSVVLPLGRPHPRQLLSLSHLRREARLRQVRQLTEIQDAVRRLRPTLDVSVRDVAEELAMASGRTGRSVTAAAEAAWIDIACRAARERGLTVAADSVEAGRVEVLEAGHRPGGNDIETEAGWMAQVALALSDHELMQAVRRRWEAHDNASTGGRR